MKNNNTAPSRKFKYSSFSTIFIIVFIAVIILINILASALQARFPLSLDLTKDRVFSLSDTTKEYVSKIEGEINIYVLQPESSFSGNTAGARMSEAFAQYTKINPNVKVTYMDFAANPAFVQKYEADKVDRNSIIIESESTHFVISVDSLFTFQYDNYGNSHITSDRIESVMTSKLVAVSQEKVPTFAVVTGHNEVSMESLQSLLETNGCKVVTCDLALADIPADANFVVLSVPRRDYSSAEIAKLDAFMASDQFNPNVVAIFNPVQGSLPNLEGFLAEWGIKPLPGVLTETDPSRHSTTDATIAVANFTESEYANALGRSVTPTVFNSRAIEILFESKGDLSVRPLLQMADTTKNVVRDVDGRMVSEEFGTYYPLVMATSTQYINGQSHSANVFAVGGNDFFQEQMLTRGNGQLTMSIVNRLAGRKDEIYIPERPFDPKTMNLSQSQVVFVGLIIFTIAIPLAVLITGLYIWMKRRHL